MNINRAESLTGLAAANIRYYEAQGLVSPVRRQNGYREYSDADIETLLRIKLLRGLGLPIDGIRRLQSGEQTLSDALSEQLRYISEQTESLAAADRLCRRLREDGADYETLDAAKYLAPEEPVSDSYIRTDTDGTGAHPWHRLFARAVDIGLYSLIAVLLFFTLPHRPPVGAWSFGIRYVAFALMFVFEPLLICLFGTTPGKLIMGIRITESSGKKPGYISALVRTALMFFEGMGLGVPVVMEVMCLISLRRCRRDALSWDGGFCYVHFDPRDARVIAAAAAVAVLIFAQNAAKTGSILPPNRGELTVAEFAENFNFVCGWAGIEDWSLDENGEWVAAEPDPDLISFPPEEDTVPCEISFETDAAGNIRAIAFDLEREDGLLYGEGEPIVGLYPAAYYAVILSRESFRCLSLDLMHLRSTTPTVWADWDAELLGVSLSWRVTDNGGFFPSDITGFHAGIVINAP